jgi:hypothetical protein
MVIFQFAMLAYQRVNVHIYVWFRRRAQLRASAEQRALALDAAVATAPPKRRPATAPAGRLDGAARARQQGHRGRWETGDPGLDADELGGLRPFFDVFGMFLFVIFEKTLRPDTNELVESIF